MFIIIFILYLLFIIEVSYFILNMGSISTLWETIKCLGSGGSMVARLKLKEIDGRAPPGVEPAA